MLQFPGCSSCLSSLVNARFLQVSGDPLQQLNSHKLSLCRFPDSTYFEEQTFCSTRSMCKPNQPSELQFLCCWHTDRCTCTCMCILMYLHVCARPPRLCPGSTSADRRREHLPQGHPAGMMPASGGYSSTHRHIQLWTSKVSTSIVLIVTENGPVERRKVLWLSNKQNQLHGQPSLWTCLVPPHAAETVFPTFLPHSSVPFHYVAV